MSVKKNDPCVSICKFDSATGWCVACGRTVPEARAWRKMMPFKKTALVRELPRRIAQLKNKNRLLSAVASSHLVPSRQLAAEPAFERFARLRPSLVEVEAPASRGSEAAPFAHEGSVAEQRLLKR